MTKTFVWETEDLSRSALIAASAGTGKTFTLEHVVARLIIDEAYGCTLDEILVVTFTNKAAAELKSRVRKILTEQRKSSELGAPARERVDTSLSLYDRAPIFTIHGFCQQLLRRFPLENRVIFGSTVSADDGGLLETALRDKLRAMDLAGTRDAELLTLAVNQRGSFEALVEYLLEWLRLWDDQDKLRGDFPLEDGLSLESRLAEILREMGAALPSVDDLLAEKKRLGIRQTKPTVEKFCAQDFEKGPYDMGSKTLRRLAKGLTAGWEVSSVPAGWEAFADSTVRYIELWEAWAEDMENPLPLAAWSVNALGRNIAEEVFRKAAFLRNRQGIMLYDDLIDGVYRSVRDSGQRQVMRRAMKREYRLVLLDEFQDTDARQWEIFRGLFSTWLMVGDPKQSIYRFRGADLGVYYQAGEAVPSDRHFFLATNYRSVPPYVAGVNRFFSRIFDPKNHCGHGKAREWQNSQAAKDQKSNGAPFVFLPTGELESPQNNSVVHREVLRRITDEIESLVGQGTAVPSEIAVLTDTNRQAEEMKDLLLERSINCVVSRNQSLFKSTEARDLELLLSALAEPRRQGLIKTALLTGWFGLSSQEMAILGGDEEFSQIVLAFMEWAEQINRGELLKAFEGISRGGSLLLAAGLRGRVSSHREEFLKLTLEERSLSVRGGERSYTNRYHLLDCLKEWQLGGLLSCAELAQGLQKKSRDSGSEEEMQRLERDDDAVNIMTLHASKGLQFSMVFYAGGLRGKPSSRGGSCQAVRYTAPEGNRVRDLLERPSSRELMYREEWEEAKRRFYVALTRGVARVYLPFPRNGSDLFELYSHYAALAGESLVRDLQGDLGLAAPPELPLHLNKDSFLPKKIRKQDFIIALAGRLEDFLVSLCRKDPEIFRWDTPQEVGQAASSLVPAEPEAGEGAGPRLLSRPWERKNQYPRVMSFTSLNRQEVQPLSGLNEAWEEGEAGEDSHVFQEALEEREGAVTGEKDPLLDLAPGSRFGDAVHALFEELPWHPFQMARSADELWEQKEIRGLVEEKLRMSFKPDWVRAQGRQVLQLIWETLGTPLAALGGEPLVALQREDRRPEVEFLLHLPRTGVAQCPGFRGDIVPGYLKGFIDLVFRHQKKLYLADWKTTRAGDSRGDYDPRLLERVMEEHGYKGQALIYLSALVQESERVGDFDYERDFGGIFYFFVRAMRRAGDSEGVFFWRPSEAEFRRFRESWLSGEVL